MSHPQPFPFPSSPGPHSQANLWWLHTGDLELLGAHGTSRFPPVMGGQAGRGGCAAPGDVGIAAFWCFQTPVLANPALCDRGHSGGGGWDGCSGRKSRRKKLLCSLSFGDASDLLAVRTLPDTCVSMRPSAFLPPTPEEEQASPPRALCLCYLSEMHKGAGTTGFVRSL